MLKYSQVTRYVSALYDWKVVASFPIVEPLRPPSAQVLSINKNLRLTAE